MGAVPVLVRVRVWAADAPTAMSPKLKVEGTACRCDWMPMPVRGMLIGRVLREVATLAMPVRVPVCVGTKVICAVQLVAGASGLPAVGQSLVAE